MTDIERLACSMTYEQNLMKLNEEMGELSQAISKMYADDTLGNRQAVIEEMVDVMISMDAVRIMLQISDAEVIDMKHYKMIRNLQRLKVKEYGKEFESR